MNKAPELRERIDPPVEINEAGLNGNLVLFIGAGASMLLGLPSWSGLAISVLNELRDKEFLNYSEIEQLKTLDPRKQLSIAYLIAQDNGYDLDITKYLQCESKDDNIYNAINKIGCPCVTTNYDEQIAPIFISSRDGSTTASQVIRISDRDKFHAMHLNEPGTVVHLHGAMSRRETMVVTTKEYLEHYDDEKVQTFLSELFTKKTVLFLGYGLEEAEILEHILRRGHVRQTNDRRRFVLQGYFRTQQPLYERLHSYYEKSFGVHLLGFLRDHDNYDCLASIIKDWVNKIEVRKQALTEDVDFMNEVLDND